GGTAVVLPDPGGAASTAMPGRASAARSAGRTASTGSAGCVAPGAAASPSAAAPVADVSTMPRAFLLSVILGLAGCAVGHPSTRPASVPAAFALADLDADGSLDR